MRNVMFDRTATRRTEETAIDTVNVVLGVYLALSPWVLGFTGELAAAWNAWISGVTVAVLAVAGLAAVVDRGLNIVIGFWIAISPWVIGFATDAFTMWNHFLVGLAVWGLEAARLLRSTPGAPGRQRRRRFARGASVRTQLRD